MSANHRHPWVEGSHRGKAWTAAEVGVLQDLHDSHTAREIGVLLGRTKQSVAGKLATLNLKGNTPREAPSATLAEEIALAKREWSTAPQYRPERRDV